LHGFNLAAQINLCPARKFCFAVAQDLLDPACHAGQIGTLDRAVDVNDGLRVVVAQRPRLGAPHQRREIAQDLRLLAEPLVAMGKFCNSCRSFTSYCGVCTAML